MRFDLIVSSAPLSPVQLQSQLARCNRRTARWGLELTLPQLQELASHRLAALRATGQVEFGEGVLEQLAAAFADSPHLDPANYQPLLLQLQGVFYYFRGEAPEAMSDAELIEIMRRIFNTSAGGSVEYLAETGLEELCHALRLGETTDDPIQRFQEEYHAYLNEADN